MSFRGLAGIDKRIQMYPQDQEYREELAKNLGCKADRLGSVVGTEELKDIVSKLSPDNFSVGDDFANVNNGTHKVNLHIHTIESDGNMTVEELLNQAVEYADKVKDPPFIIALTNHDTIKDTIITLEIISKNPEKFRKVKFIPGVEITAKYVNNELFDKPIQLEVIGYSINPFDKDLNKLLDVFKEDNINYGKELVAKAQKIGLNASFEEAKGFHNLINIGASPAFVRLLFDYLLDKAEEQGFDSQKIEDLIQEHIREYKTEYVFRSTPEIADVLNFIRTGLLGIAHPGRICLKGLKHHVSGKEAIESLFNKFNKLGGTAAEINYQYKSDYYNPESNAWLNHIARYAEKLGILKTGGIDNHSKSIFICKM
ncbi:MAG: hypothetical protein AB1782_01905 [Cyanobacteriota bacterium]